MAKKAIFHAEIWLNHAGLQLLGTLAGDLGRTPISDDRKQFSNFKTRDTELSRKRSQESEVFYSYHGNEITIDNTDLTADVVADKIIEHLEIRKHQE